jgi:intracellular multiplication protein IcmO
MAIDTKYELKHTDILRDARPLYVRIGEWFMQPDNSFVVYLFLAFGFHFYEPFLAWADLFLVFGIIYFFWLNTRDRSIAFKLPFGTKHKDKNARSGKAEGILYLGNTDPKREEVWFSNSDARTHILYLGTTGAGKTEGLKSIASNTMTWASGFVYIDGKADTDLWSSLSSLVRRFGRDDDLLVLNYMTGNSDRKAPSNTMNPFSSGSASYLTNMLVSLMPEAEGDNAMWKERAVSLISSLMPIMTWRRDNQDIPMSVGQIRQSLTLSAVVKMSRDESLPEHLRMGVKGYLETLPGYVDAAFDDEGRDKPMGPDQPMIDTTTAKTQHGYLTMQFTRSLQSLADDYGYIFDSQAADVDMVDVVLNRRILIVLIPALEKSSDETANLGKIVAATLKGMMGSTLGATVEGESASVIENKPTHSATPFMTIFDEVGYYAAQGMAVMAAQARSLGFSMVFSAQDLPALEKRVKEEARSIAANCNIKIFGKLEDPTQTKEFFEKTVGSSFVMEASGFQTEAGSLSHTYSDSHQGGVQVRGRANYDAIRGFKEGQAVIAFGERVVDAKMYYSNPGHAKAMRVTRYIALPPPDENVTKHRAAVTALRDLMVKKNWTAAKADVAIKAGPEIEAIAKELGKDGIQAEEPTDRGVLSVAALYIQAHPEALHQNPVAEQPAASPAAQSAPASPAASTGGSSPMSFFGSKKPESLPAENAGQENNPVSWQDLVEENAEGRDVNLDEATRNVLEEAARKARQSIFQTDEDSNDKNPQQE